MASLRLLLFYIYFRSLLINTRLIFISYFVSVPLRKGHRGSEYKCSFVRLYLFLFAFLIICIETFGFHRLFCNKGMCDLTNTIKSPIQYIRTDYRNRLLGKDSSNFVSAMHKISIFQSTILSKSRDLLLIELIFRYEKMIVSK